MTNRRCSRDAAWELQGLWVKVQNQEKALLEGTWDGLGFEGFI